MPVLTFRFDTLRVTLGGVAVAIGAGLPSLVPDLRVAAIIVFFLGIALTLSGLITVGPRGVIFHAQWSQGKILNSLSKAPADSIIWILQTWIPEEDFADYLQRMYRDEGKRFELQIMLMDPTPQGDNDVLAARVKLRWIERAKAAENINDTINRLVRLKGELEATLNNAPRSRKLTETVDLTIKLYDFMPFGPVYKIGENVMYIGFYLNNSSSIAGPMIEIRRIRSPKLWRIFEQNLLNGWDASIRRYPSLTAEGSHD
jgi:hypothetical protein